MNRSFTPVEVESKEFYEVIRDGDVEILSVGEENIYFRCGDTNCYYKADTDHELRLARLALTS